MNMECVFGDRHYKLLLKRRLSRRPLSTVCLSETDIRAEFEEYKCRAIR